jgi:hypothetical protein
MSNGRRGNTGNAYRSGFLRSRAWFARRSRWFHDAATSGPIRCALCRSEGTPSSLELHHLDYTGVTRRGVDWFADEAHDDLMPVHPRCHTLIHRLIDRDVVLRRHRNRRDATHEAIVRIRARLSRRNS